MNAFIENGLIIWGIVCAVAGVFGIISGVIRDGEFIFSKTKVAKLQKTVETHSEYIKNDHERFEKIEAQIEVLSGKLEKIESKTNQENEKINESLAVLGTSLAALLNHMIDGNGVEQMKEERTKITSYFFNR